MDKINWYPPIPAGLEVIDGKVLDRSKQPINGFAIASLNGATASFNLLPAG